MGARRGRRDRRAGLRGLAARTRVLATTVGPYCGSRQGGRSRLRRVRDALRRPDRRGALRPVVARRARRPGPGDRGAPSCTRAASTPSPPTSACSRRPDASAADGEGTLAETTLLVRSLKGGFSGGTIDSARQQAITARADARARAVLGDPYALSPRRSEEPPSGRRRPAASGCGVVGSWTGCAGSCRSTGTRPRAGGPGPFVMASFNTRIVRLSNTLTDWSYGRDLRYREATDFGSGPMSPVMAGGMAVGLGGVVAGMAYRPTRAVIDRFLPKPGEGPSPETQAAGASGSTSARRRRPGRGTARGSAPTTTPATAARRSCSVRRRSPSPSTTGLPRRVGVCTPATALGEVLVERLRAQGFTFDVERLSEVGAPQRFGLHGERSHDPRVCQSGTGGGNACVSRIGP